MNAFIEAYLDRIRAVSNEPDLRALCGWLYARQPAISATAAAINSALHLDGPFALQPDLPCLFVGSTTGLVLLSANPAWDKSPRGPPRILRSPRCVFGSSASCRTTSCWP